jgi:CubicO group peptidase (beta-lactamase class C family)
MSCGKDDLKTDPNAIYRPLQMDDWENSTPTEQELDPDLILTLYTEAETLSNIYSLLIVKNNYLVAERYFNDKTVFSSHKIASVTKSYVSALTGIALRENILTDLDQSMVSFFPEYDWGSMDPRKSEITLREI